MASKPNVVRDLALSLSAASIIVLTTVFCMKQCSGADKSDAEKDEKLPKIEVVNNNNIVVDGGKTSVKNNSSVVVADSVAVKNNNDVVANGGKTSVKSNSKVVTGKAVVVENNNEIVAEQDCKKCGDDTLVVKIIEEKTVQKKKVQPKPQPKPAPAVVRDTVYLPAPVKQDTVKNLQSQPVASADNNSEKSEPVVIAWGYVCTMGNNRCR